MKYAKKHVAVHLLNGATDTPDLKVASYSFTDETTVEEWNIINHCETAALKRDGLRLYRKVIDYNVSNYDDCHAVKDGHKYVHSVSFYGVAK